MSHDVLFNDNETPSDSTDDFYEGDLIIRTFDEFSLAVKWNRLEQSDGVDTATIMCDLPQGESDTKQGFARQELPAFCDQMLSSISSDKKSFVCVRKDFNTNGAPSYAEKLLFRAQVL